MSFFFTFIILVSIPFLTFLKFENLTQLVNSDIQLIILLYCFVILIILLLSKILTYCFLKNKFYKETLLCLSFIFLELFYFNKIYDFLATPGISRYFIYFISVIFLIFFNLISLYILIKIKKKLLLFSKIFILLTIINIFVFCYFNNFTFIKNINLLFLKKQILQRDITMPIVYFLRIILF